MLKKLLHYMFFCHRLPERSFFYKGIQFPICARCTGILVGYFLGITYILTIKTNNFFIALLLLSPTAIDGIGQLYGKWISTNRRRFITGLLAGISTIMLLDYAANFGLSSGRYVTSLLN